MLNKKLNVLLILFSICTLGFAQNGSSSEISANNNLKLRAVAEIGFLSVLGNQVQFSNSGTYFNYVQDGGQDNLFPINRLSLELEVKKRHTITLLYQPLRLESTAVLTEDIMVDELLFPSGTPVNFLYNFPFFRASYMKELAPNNDKFDFALGASLQLRNATISFESTDGSLFRSNRDIGPVPILKFRTRYKPNPKTYTEMEADGFYAPISYLNGSDNEVIGAILDASLRQGLNVTDEVGLFLNLRYLGGGAVGTSDDNLELGDGYVRNWLHFATVSVGFIYEFSEF